MRIQRHLASAVALTTAALLAMTGCSSSGAGGTSGERTSTPAADPTAVYNFTQINGMAPAKAIRVEVPQALKTAAGTDAQGLLVNSVTAKAHDLGNATVCAIDLSIDYADGAVEKLTAPTYTPEQAAADIRDDKKAFLDFYQASSVSELKRNTAEGAARELFSSAAQYIFVTIGRSRIEGLGDRYAAVSQNVNATVDEIVQAVYADIEQYRQTMADDAASVPTSERLGERLGLGHSEEATAFDANSPKTGSYVSADFKSATIVQDCAKSTTDPDSTSKFDFPVPSDDDARSFASVELTVMKNGDLNVASGEVEAWMLDANGDWIAK